MENKLPDFSIGIENNKIRKLNFLTKGIVVLCSVIYSYVFIFVFIPLVLDITTERLTDYDIALYNNIDSSVTKRIVEKEKKISMLEKTAEAVPIAQAQLRNQYLVNSLLQHQSIITNFEKAERESRNEIRIYYFTIISALMAYIFLKKKHIMLSMVGLIIVIFIMYSLDIHYRDLELQQHKSAVITSYTIRELTNIPSSCEVYYNINFDTVSNYMKKFKGTVENRKLIMFSYPDVVQDRLYRYSLTFVLFLFIYNIFIWLIKTAESKN